MIEVTNQNFNTIYPDLERALKDANFIAIDTEFTGIHVDNIKNSLFDSIKEHYEKQRCNIQPYIIIQFGITTFQRIQDENQYKAEAFNFHLLPRSIPSKSRQFVWQISALEFLTANKFDFNKIAYEGISYLNEIDEAILQKQIQNNELFYNLQKSISYEEEDNLKDYINQVFEWLNTANVETNSFKIDTPTPNLQYLMHKELRNRFSNVWTFSGNNMVTVMKISPDSRKILEQNEGSILENVLLESYIGFSKVFKLLVTLKKPIIAHNALLDLMFIYQQFYKPLPQNYTDFKNNIHQLFPIIYDTKFLSYQLRDLLSTKQKWKYNSLNGLVQYFMEKQGKYLSPGSPNVMLTCKINSDESDIIYKFVTPLKKYHIAGWDSYFAGYVFIRMIHTFATKSYENCLSLKYFTHTELMNNAKSFANCINIIQGSTSHLKLEGSEPVSTRPKWLFVKTLTKPITAKQITEEMSIFGTVDVKQCTSKRVLVAVANHRSARDILQHYEQNKELYVVPYNPIRHSSSVRFVVWSSIIVSSGIFTWMLHQKLQKS